jgi:hypothetical protein
MEFYKDGSKSGLHLGTLTLNGKSEVVDYRCVALFAVLIVIRAGNCTFQEAGGSLSCLTKRLISDDGCILGLQFDAALNDETYFPFVLVY